ncbi:MAG: hypothetical protein AB1725_00335 [Armatimonadota bacterium]
MTKTTSPGVIAILLLLSSTSLAGRIPFPRLLALPPPQAQNPNVFNPQIAVVGDFQARLTDTGPEPQRSAIVREVELGIAADVDPFARAEFYIAVENEFGHEEEATVSEGDGTVVDVEEAFLTFHSLGAGFSAKVGKVAGAVGRVNRNHRDQLEFTEYPLAIRAVLGEEGLRAPGGSLSYLFPSDRFHEFTLEVLSPEDGPLFAGSDLGKPLLVGRYRTFFDFSADLTALAGLTYVDGPTEGGSRSRLYGADYTMKWQPGTRGKSAVFEAEAYWFKPGTGITTERETRFSGFAALTYEVAPRWFVTGKYDHAEVPDGSDTLRAYSLGVSFKLTEFQLIRAEAQRLLSDIEADRTVVTLQFQWVIGAHPAHKY